MREDTWPKREREGEGEGETEGEGGERERERGERGERGEREETETATETDMGIEKQRQGYKKDLPYLCVERGKMAGEEGGL